MKTILNTYTLILLLSILALNGCTKDFLNTKPESDLVIPSTLSDLQALLDDNNDLNLSPVLGEFSGDDYYMDYNSWESLFYGWERNVYIWSPDIFGGIGGIQDWNASYKEILYANVVLGQLDKIGKTADNENTWNNIKGSALFIRSLAFFNLAQEFAPVYDSTTADNDLGIPLRLTPDINSHSIRSTLKETYNRILSDLNESKDLLSSLFPYNNRNRPSKQAALALLARIYLSVGAYKDAGLYADSTLSLYNKLMDYNSLDTTSSNPFSIDNDEVIYQIRILDSDPTIYITFSQGYSIDTTLYNSYSYNDLRRSLYFVMNGNYINFKGDYYNNGILSNALTTDEMYLIRSECEARNGAVSDAMDDLNVLLVKRWKIGTFIPYNAANANDALNIILQERRKELVMRELRWTDLRRLNKEGFNIMLTRRLNDKIYTLPPNDPRYVLPIPPDVIELSGIQQNVR